MIIAPTRQIPLTRPWLDDEDVAAAARPILSGWVTQGAEVAGFEAEFAAAVGAPHACAVSSCTAALHLALLAMGTRPGDEVVTVSHTFVATANAIRAVGAVPVFVDIEPATYNMAPDAVARAITARTRVVLCVHQMGMPCDLSAIVEIADRHGVGVLEDAACAAGSAVMTHGDWQPIGRPHGDIACFSFHPRKVLTTGDGGMLTTRSSVFDERVRRWRQHGMSISDTARHAASRVVFESYPDVGFNYRMTDIQAAIGRVQLRRLDEIVVQRRAIAAAYAERLAAVPGIVVPVEPAGCRSNWQSYCVRLPAGRDQRAVMQHLLDAGIASRRGIMCVHREAPYRDAARVGALQASEVAQDRAIQLPIFPHMTLEEVDAVVHHLERACRS